MRSVIHIALCIIIFASLAGCAAQGRRVGAATKPVVVKKSVRTFVLGNGATLIVKEGRKPGPTALQVWVTQGSLSDPEGMPGISHFVEHMLFTGSLHLPKGRMEHYLESMGGRLSGHTGRDFSYIGVTLPGPGWQRGLDILYDLAAYPLFKPEDVGRQKKVVQLEIAQREREPDTLVIDNLFGAAYVTNQYRNPVTGTERDVAGFTRDDVSGYYSETYVPSNMVIVVVGDVDTAEVRAAAEKTFGAIAMQEYTPPRARPEAFQAHTRTKSAEGPYGLTYMAMGWHICSASDPDMYAAEVLRAILGQGKGSRLFQELRERMGAAFDVEAELFPLREPGLFVLTAHLKADDLRRVTSEVLRQVNKLKDEYVTDAELARAVDSIEAGYLLDNETAEGQAYGLGYWATVHGEDDPGMYVENIRRVTPEDLRRVAQKYLGEGNYTLSLVGPEGGR
ncbi:MAG: insulinase family protein [Nitrospirae bacterium]|nr:insulinase family protein [Nitrospirota bacterium]